MEWSGQQNQVPQHAPQPAAGSVSSNGFYGNNPLQGARPGQVQQSAATPAPQLNQAPSQPPAVGFGTQPPMPPVAPQQAMSSMQMDDSSVDVGDVQWVNRAKRAIAGTHGDPHRQVQLIQHLRSQYLRQRFGRMVHTDEA